MKISIEGLNKTFENRVKLGIMSSLAMNERLDFTSLKEYLEVTDGNLASHLKTLEKEGYVTVEKSFIERKPNTKYRMTTQGEKAFKKHIAALEKIIRSQK